ncbi:extracellular solute-binding protein [Phototrophicus methaneseepsis]|uniref:Extracellular solute-binding protein n=1 Tax=Phototrophicus methaneseepsis TaxID=2710758 RepID=A0A7S8E8J8_9CHLR|nr:extracellular solute-binding protein [Phototrophicus methaneseepsis]QPC82359.1 extracellular solute-binding protein [Phototrophicus methaneseepsis]
MRKFALLTLLTALLVGLVPVSAQDDVTTVRFWTAPDPNQEVFWAEAVEQWNTENPTIQIEWQPIPTGASSEEVILNAIATGTAPDISNNIFSGFAAQMAESGAAVALDEQFDDFWDVVEGRQMRSIVENGWSLNDHYYVLPQYSNAMQYWWNLDLVEQAGFSAENPPRTYSDVAAVAEAISDGDTYAIGFPGPANWWDRWFGFITLYYAAAGGQPYLDLANGEVLFDNDAGYAVASFMDEMFANGWAPTDTTLVDPLQEGIVAGFVMGPWAIASTAENYPDLRYVITPPPVPDDYPADEPIYTFADAKGFVMYQQSEVKEEAWQFLKWLLGDPELDMRWLDLTGLPPVREDLTTNELFTTYLEANPEIATYASQIPYAVPPALSSATIPIQRIMGRELTEPIWQQTIFPDEAIDNAAGAIEDYFALGS